MDIGRGKGKSRRETHGFSNKISHSVTLPLPKLAQLGSGGMAADLEIVQTAVCPPAH